MYQSAKQDRDFGLVCGSSEVFLISCDSYSDEEQQRECGNWHRTGNVLQRFAMNIHGISEIRLFSSCLEPQEGINKERQ